MRSFHRPLLAGLLLLALTSVFGAGGETRSGAGGELGSAAAGASYPRGPGSPGQVPALGTLGVLLAAAAMGFAAYASRRGLRVVAQKGSDLAVLLGVAGALAGFVGGLSMGRVQEAGILLLSGFLAAGLSRSGLAYRGARAPVFAGGAALTAAAVGAMVVFALRT